MALTIPNTFVAGTKIEAAPVNSNFAEVANAVDKRGDTLTGNLAANAGVKVDGVDISSIPVDGSGNFNPLFTFVVFEAATTAGIRLDLESGVLAVREGDDSGYGPLISGQHTVSGSLLVATNDGGALGASGTAWSDLFLASGGVINLGASDVTITHSTNTLTFAGASSGYVFNDGPMTVNGLLTASYAANTNATFDFKNTDTGASANTLLRLFNGTNDSFVIRAFSASHATSANVVSLDSNRAGGLQLFASHASGAISFYTGGTTEQMRLTSGGNLALDATARLYLDGVAGTGDTYIYEYTGNVIDVMAGGNLKFRVNGTATDLVSAYANFAIDSGKKLYLDGGNDTYLHEPAGNQVNVVCGGATGAIILSDQVYLQGAYTQTTANAASVWVASDGQLRRSTSSLRYKHAVETLDTTDAHAALMAMRPVTYRSTTDEDQRRHVGFIAEEMQQIAPLLCTYDEGGESGTPNYVTYDRVTAYLVAVVQQQQTEIDALKARIH